ncbi:MAG: carboxypeptidase-like regulatory domain-containing protein [Bacteroidota bacterium]
MSRLIILSLCWLCCTSVHAQNRLLGQVQDDAGQDILGANVYTTVQPSEGVISDLQGQFHLLVPSYPVEIVVSFIGYQSDTITVFASTDHLLIVLQEQAFDLLSVTVSAEDPISAQFAATSLDKMDIYLSPVAQGDPLKAITALPFSTNTDESANPVLRGSGADRSRVLFNGVPIYEPVRSSQLNNQGFFSLFNPAIIDQMTIFPSNPPLIYGNSSAGLVDLQTVQQLEQQEWQLSTGLATAGAFFSRRLGKTRNFIQAYGNIQFPDAYVALNRPNLPRLKAFHTKDAGLNVHVQKKKVSWNSFHYMIDEGYAYQSNQFSYEGLADANKQRYFQVNNFRVLQERFQIGLDQGFNWSQSGFAFGNLRSRNETIQTYEAVKVKWWPTDQWSLQVGANHEYQRQAFQDTIPQFYYAFAPESPTYFSETTLDLHSLEAYGFVKLNTPDWGTWQLGLRSNVPIHQQAYFLSAQVTWNYQPHSKHRILVGLGRYHNYSTSNFFSPLFDLQSSDQLALDYQWKGRNLELHAAIFWKQEQTEPASIPGFSRSATETLGVEFGLNGQFGQWIRWNCSNVYLHQRVRQNEISYRGRQDLPYQIKATLQFQHPKWCNLALTWQHRPGNRFTGVIDAQINPMLDFYEPVFSEQWNGEQLATYQRLDININRFFAFERFDLVTFLTIGNVLNRSNQRTVLYDRSYQERAFEHFQFRSIYFGLIWQKRKKE